MAWFALRPKKNVLVFPQNCPSQVHLPYLSLKDLFSEEVMALANTMKLARFANGPLARLGENLGQLKNKKPLLSGTWRALPPLGSSSASSTPLPHRSMLERNIFVPELLVQNETQPDSGDGAGQWYEGGQ